MCRYNIAIDDALMEQVRPAIGVGVEEAAWVQLQVESLFRKLAVKARSRKKQGMLSQRLRGIGTAPDGFDYKKELVTRFE